MTRALPPLFLFIFLAACAPFPQVGRAEALLASPSDTPPLLTEAELAAATGAAPDQSSALAGEAAALRARAEHLRQR